MPATQRTNRPSPGQVMQQRPARARPHWTLLALAASLMVVLGACSSNTGTASQSAAAGSGGNVVKLSGFQFNPTALTVPVGTKVTFENMDSTDHTVTNGKDGTPDANALFNQTVHPGSTFDFTFTKAGTYNVTCMIHHSMNMTIMVQ